MMKEQVKLALHLPRQRSLTESSFLFPNLLVSHSLFTNGRYLCNKPCSQ
jgi:hypothetical protein